MNINGCWVTEICFRSTQSESNMFTIIMKIVAYNTYIIYIFMMQAYLKKKSTSLK